MTSVTHVFIYSLAHGKLPGEARKVASLGSYRKKAALRR